MPDADVLARLRALAERATEADGSPPFSDQALVEAQRGERLVEVRREWALVRTDHPAPEIEFVVDPDARGAGIGTRIADDLASRFEHFTAWAHGDHPAAGALAARVGANRVRAILQMRRPLDGVPPARARLRAFTPDDTDALLATNAAAFAHHPEQGALTRADLDDRFAADWFAPDDLLVVDGPDGTLKAFIWCKVQGEVGELYVVAVHPDWQGTGLGKTLTAAALAHLAAKGVRFAHLYVDADDARAVGLYRAFGFADAAIDVQFAR